MAASDEVGQSLMVLAARTRAGADQIAALVAAGMGYSAASRQIAEKYGVSERTARGWVDRVGLDIPSEPREDFQDFNQRRRAEAGNKLAEALEMRTAQVLAALRDGEPVPTRELKDLAIMFGVLTDKRRLEDGLATDRHEQQSIPAREIIEAKILSLSARKKQKKIESVN